MLGGHGARWWLWCDGGVATSGAELHGSMVRMESVGGGHEWKTLAGSVVVEAQLREARGYLIAIAELDSALLVAVRQRVHRVCRSVAKGTDESNVETKLFCYLAGGGYGCEQDCDRGGKRARCPGCRAEDKETHGFCVSVSEEGQLGVFARQEAGACGGKDTQRTEVSGSCAGVGSVRDVGSIGDCPVASVDVDLNWFGL